MYSLHRLLLTAALVSLPIAVTAQTAADPSGHWEGMVQAPEITLAFEIDLHKTAKGALAGTFGQPAQGVKGFPLSSVSNEGQSVRFVVKAGEQPSTFDGTLSADGKSMSGEVTQAGFRASFSMTRTGEARVTVVPPSAAIGKELEGAWSGTLELAGRQLRLIVRMENQPDGTAKGTVVSPDGSGIEIPIAMTQKGSTVTIDVPSVSASFAGVLDAEKKHISGTWTQGGSSLPLTLGRAQ